MDQFFCRSAAVPEAGIVFVEDDHTARFNPRVGSFHGGGDEIGVAHIRDEPAALVHLQEWLLTVFPLGHPDFAIEQAGLDADVGQGFGQRKGAAPGFLAGLGAGVAHVEIALFFRAAFMDRREREIASHRTGGGAGVHPGQFKYNQCVDEVLWTFDISTLGRIHEGAGQAGFVVSLQQFVFLGSPIVGVALALRDETRDRTARHAAGRLHKHL